jgi:hypothetical protein
VLPASTFIGCAVNLFSRTGLLWLMISTTFGFNDSGHMIISTIAYRDLDREVQRSAIQILNSHPAFRSWQLDSKRSGVDPATFIFMRAGQWADKIRSPGQADHRYDQPTWHYINYPLRAPDFPFTAAPPGTNDILFAIAQNTKMLADLHENSETRARALAWLIHLVADLHQPLHTTSLFSDEFREGDKGGNLFYITPESNPIRLHSFWDQLLGTSTDARKLYNECVVLVAKYPKPEFAERLKTSDVIDWSKESRLLAISNAYNGLDLAAGSKLSGARIPEDYTRNAKLMAESQACLAGYRLAAIISRSLSR